MRRVAAAILLLSFAAARPVRAQGSYEELQRFSDVLNHVRSNYVDSTTYRQLLHAAIDGMLRSLDPHSWYMSSEDNARFNALERGELAVTGVSLELADGVATVLSVSDGSPADRAGIRPGDRVVRIDGVPTAGLTARAIALRLAGDKGTKVRVEVERGPRLEPDSVSVSVKREMPKPANFVSETLMVDSVTGYLKLSEFGEKAATQVHDAVKSLRGRGAKRLILDLRGNPGGIVTEAVDMAGEFLPAKSLVFSTRGRQQSVNKEYRTSSDGDFEQMPMVVLIDQGSASAAEALTGSLQDNDRAIVAGRRSFGKALMQTGFLVPDGFVELTVGHVLSPSGRYIQRPYTGLQLEQYYAFAGDSAWQDTTRIFHTVHGRPEKGGGGIAPDVALPPPPGAPRWWTVAADSGWDRAIADSVANTLGSAPADRAAWLADSSRWNDRVLLPFLGRVRARLAIAAAVDAPSRAAMSRRLAADVATVRWNEEAGRELSIRNDPDVIAARGLFARSAAILGH
ncbi:MAG TPA: S41 family peptidase [Gemmatimonadales bacterium]